MTTATAMAELPALTGQELGRSDWIEVTQDRVTTVAAVIDREGSDQPVCVAEPVVRFFG
jgi:acyl dehydratase